MNHAKKLLIPDEHAWLIKYIVRYFKDIVIDANNRTLWDELNLFYLAKNNECDYRYDNKERVYLYPVLNFNPKRNKIDLLGFRSVSKSVYHLLCDDFLTSEIIQPVETNLDNEPLPVLPPVESKQKSGFFKRLLNKKHAPTESVKPATTALTQFVPTAPEFDEIDGSNHDYLQHVTGVNLKEVERILPLAQAINLLAKLNDIDQFDAKALLMTGSYKRKFEKEKFINLLDNKKTFDRDSYSYHLRFDVAYLFSSGFLGLESLQLYRDSIPANQMIDMEFDLNLKY